MITLEELIKNEMTSVLGHEPTKPEMDSMSAFIAGRKITYLTELELAIADWKNACTRECTWCGDRFLESEMIHTAGSEWFCGDQCKKDYKDEHGVAECTE